MSAFFCLFFHFQARNCGFFTINPYFWTPKIGLSEAKLAMNDYFVKLSPISVNINPVIWSRLFLVKIIPHIHHPRLQRVFRPSLSLLRREERAGSLLIKKRRTSSLRGAYAYLIINHHEGFISWWFCCIPTVFYKHCWQPYFIYDNFNLSELSTTLTLEKAIRALAHIGVIWKSMPKMWSAPAANGMQMML